MLHPTSPSARRCLLWDEVLSATVRSCVFIQHKSLTFCFCFVATSRFTDFLRTFHYVLWQLWQLVVTRFVITFIGWMFLNILFRFQDSTHPEQLCLARWTMSLLTAAGVDTNVWKSHSARSASALHHRRHLSVLQIHRTGHYLVELAISFIAAMCNFHSPAYQ